MEKDSFAKLPEGKQAQILQIAAEEFAQCGYDGASTNTITRRAGISKGILFHYFGSKKELYLRLLKDAVDRFAAMAERQTAEIRGTSLFESMSALFRSKAAYMTEFPLDLELMEKAAREQSPDVRGDVQQIYGRLGSTLTRQRTELAERAISPARLRSGITEAQALDCITLSLDALNTRFAALYKVRGSEILTKPGFILDMMKLYLDVVCRGLFDE